MAAEDWLLGDDFEGWRDRYGHDDECAGYSPDSLDVVCRRCRTSGLRWFHTSEGWRLRERKEEGWTPHRCPSSVGDLEDFS